MRALFCLVAFAAVPALAVEKKEIKVEDNWAVVGVIAGVDPKGQDVGIAVLRNNQTRHTYTLAIGDALPNEFGFTLKAVRNRQVVVANGGNQVTLGFAEASLPSGSGSGSGSDEDRDNRTAHFIDNYYRGLGDSPIEIFKTEREARDETPDGDSTPREGLKLPLRRFGTFKDDAARSRYDFYSSDGSYDQAGEADSDGNSGFLTGVADGDERPVSEKALEPSVYDAESLRSLNSGDAHTE